MLRKQAFLLVVAALMVLAAAGGLKAGDIDVSQPTQITSDTHYERGNSVLEDSGGNFWVFYGRHETFTGNYGTGNPDNHQYVIYYKKAGSVAGLAGATAQAVGSMPVTADKIYQGQTACVEYGGDIWVFGVDMGDGGGQVKAWTTSDGGTSWSVSDVLPGVDPFEGFHLWTTVYNSKIYLAVTRGGNIDVTEYDGVSWSNLHTVIAHEGMPRLFVDSGNLYLYYTSWSLPAFYIYQYGGGTTWTPTATITGTADADSDPMLARVGTDYVFIGAPWNSGDSKQYLMYWTASTLGGFDGFDETSAKLITDGGYGGTNWVDMWPATVDDGGAIYMFYGSEADGTSRGTGNIYMLPVDWDLTHDHYCYIQNAINGATSTTVSVAAGTYVENVVVNKSITVAGAQAGVDARGRTATESVITASSGDVVYINTNGVTFDGFKLDGAGASKLCFVDSGHDLFFQNNILGGTCGDALYFGSTSSDVTIDQNEFNGSGFSGYALFFDGGSDAYNNLVISDNDVYDGDMFAGAKTFNSTGMLMSGNLFDGGDANLSSAFTNSTIDGNTFRNNAYTNGQFGLKNSTISRNVFESAGPSPGVGYPSYGLMLWGTQYGLLPSENVTVENNEFYYNDHAAPDELCHGLRILSGIDATTIYVNGNTFEDGGWQAGARGLVNQGTGTIDASGNWWNTNVATEVPDKSDGDVDYTPWLDDGTDTSGDPGFQGDFATLWVDDDSPQTGSDGRVEEGIKLVTASTVNVLPGTYVEAGQIVVDKDVSVIGDPSDRAVIKTDSDTGSGGDARAWWLVQAGYSLTLENLVLDGTGHLIYQGIRAYGGGTMNNCDMVNILYNESGPHYSGVALVFFGTQNWTITNNTLENIGRIGIFGFGAGITGSTISGNTYTGKGVGNWLDYGIELGGGAVATITGNTITECRGVATVDGSTSAGVLITTYFAPGTAGTLTSNSITDNTTGIYVGYDGSDTAVVTAHYNDVSGNDDYGVYATSTTVVTDALSNWWGDATGPQHGTLNPGGLGVDVSDYVLFDPWIGKAGGENIVCVPDPEYLTAAIPTKTVSVDYLGGGGGLVYGYSVKFMWDDAIVSTGAAQVTQGDLIPATPPLTSVFFVNHPAGTNEMTIDCAFLGSQPGVLGPGTMFTVDFTGLAVGTSDIDITVLAVRDNNNQPLSGFYEDDGLLIVDVSPPTVANVLIWNDTLGHTDDYIKNGDTARVTATVLDDDPAFAIGNITADLQGLGGGATDPPTTYNTITGAAVWTATITSVTCLPLNGDVTVTVSATDAIGNVATPGSDTIIADNVAPTAVLDFDAVVGNQKCDLTWTLGTDLYLAGTVVQREENVGEYPTYPLFVGVWPAVVPFYPPDHTLGTNVYTGVGTSKTDAVVPRNIYYYQAFCYDIARNYGAAAATARDLSNNYWLGDVASTMGSWGFNGLVNDADIDKLGGTYFVTGPGAPNNECDVGPTVHPNGSRLGLPYPDNAIQFEDLMIFAMNYGNVAPRVVPFLPDESTKALSLELAELGVTEGGEIEVALRLEGNADEVKGLSTIISFESSDLEFLSARLSEHMYSPLAPVFFWHGAGESSVQIDLAVLGTGVTVGGSGDVAVLTFRALADEYALEFESADLRGAENEALNAELEGLELRPETPVAFRLVGNLPNPFNPVTKVVYQVPHEARVAIRVYDVAGRAVRTLIDGPVDPGQHEVVWDGRNDRGESVGSGVYFCTMDAGDFHGSHKMMLLK